MSNQYGFSPAEVLALAKMIKKKDEDQAREAIEAGDYEVNRLVRVQGEVRVGENYEQNKTASMPQTKMLLAALMLNNISIRAFVRRYLDGEFNVPKEREDDLKAIWKELADSYKAEFNGKVTTNLSVSGVGEASVGNEGSETASREDTSNVSPEMD
jgi:site-specific DNA-adenine methylase